MKFSTKARYGLRAMIELALNYDKGHIPVKTISEHQEISEAYLEQLMSFLVKRGLVRSIRGVQGGYLLTKEPQRIRVGDVVRALEGPIVPVECVNRDSSGDCKRFDNCVSRIVWERVRDVVDEALDSLTLADLCLEIQKKKETANQDYMI